MQFWRGAIALVNPPVESPPVPAMEKTSSLFLSTCRVNCTQALGVDRLALIGGQIGEKVPRREEKLR